MVLAEVPTLPTDPNVGILTASGMKHRGQGRTREGNEKMPRYDVGGMAAAGRPVGSRRSAGEFSQSADPRGQSLLGRQRCRRVRTHRHSAHGRAVEGLDHSGIKSGANGSIAAEDVARAEGDGYTWLLVTTFFTTSPSLNLVMRWDPLRDFIPVGMICQAPNVFIVPASLPVKNVAEFIALAKSKPGALNYGHPGKGSTGHLGFELFKRLAGIDVNSIGYRGYPQMVADIASGLLTSSFFSTN